MKDTQRLKILLNLEKPDFSSLEGQISEIFDTELIKLRPVQLKALALIAHYRRGFFSIGVGHGKTIISLLTPMVCRSYRALLFIPSTLVDQLTKVDIPFLEKQFNIKFDWCCIQGESQHSRLKMMNQHRLTIFPYSYLSVEDTEDLLNAANADLIVLDECHYLKNFTSARTKRFIKFLHKNSAISLVSMSGTILKRSILDYHHLINFATRQFSPVPERWVDATEIQDLIADDNFNGYGNSDFLAAVDPSMPDSRGVIFIEDARALIKKLFISSPLTVLTENQSVDCSLYIDPLISNLPIPKIVTDTITRVSETWNSPSGDEIGDYLTLTNQLAQISSGFYYRLYWAPGTPEESIYCHEMQNQFIKKVRSWIRTRHRPKLDTLGLVTTAIQNFEIHDSELLEAYKLWVESTPAKLVERKQEIHWISDYKIEYTKNWVVSNKDGIIWYKWDAVGAKLKEALPYATFCPANCPIENLQKMGILICSFGHVEGKNLQHHNNNLLFDIPTNGAQMEQLIGRTHRQGQKGDCVNVDIMTFTTIDDEILRSVYRQGRFLSDTTQSQKIIIADWNRASEFKKDS